MSTTFTFDPKTTPEDRLRIEVGDAKQAGFYPQIKVLRWDNEVNVSLRILGLAEGSLIVGQRVTWETASVICEFSPEPTSELVPEGGFEFNVILKTRPATNVLEFSLQSKGVEFLYQPLLANVEPSGLSWEKSPKGMGATIRAAGVGGGYAVYRNDSPKNVAGGKLYRSGKVGMISRPQMVDAKGMTAWGNLFIDSAAGTLTVTLPQEFLDSATYPISRAAGLTFGYTTLGGTVDCGGGGAYVFYNQLDALSPAGSNTDTNHSWGAPSNTCGGAAGDLRMALYTDSAGSPNSKLVEDGSDTTVATGADHFVTGPAVSYALAASTQYWLAHVRVSGALHGALWDTGGTRAIKYQSGTSLPATASVVGTIATNVHPSAYVTYAAAGGGKPWYAYAQQ